MQLRSTLLKFGKSTLKFGNGDPLSRNNLVLLISGRGFVRGREGGDLCVKRFVRFLLCDYFDLTEKARRPPPLCIENNISGNAESMYTMQSVCVSYFNVRVAIKRNEFQSVLHSF